MLPVWAFAGAMRPLTQNRLCSALFVAFLIFGGGSAFPDSGRNEAEWHEFEGTLTAAGSRQLISLGGARQASIADYNGTLMLYGSSRPALGFGVKAIVLYDSATGLLGRAVWTDDTGNQVYSELRGDAGSSDHILGTFVGGSGRYQGATGTYEFSWRFLLETEDGTVQAQSMGLHGKVRYTLAAGGAQP